MLVEGIICSICGQACDLDTIVKLAAPEGHNTDECPENAYDALQEGFTLEMICSNCQ